MTIKTTLGKFYRQQLLSWTLLVGAALLTLAPATFAATNLTVAGNGDGIPYPTATNTYAVTNAGKTMQVPVGMVYVPAGSFTYGTGATTTNVVLDGFCIGKFPVTEAEYKAFVDATHLTTYPSHWTNGTYPGGKTNHPVPYASLTNALKYCAWVSSNTGWHVTIPTAAEWEKAARGTNAYLYPWGNSADVTYSAGVLNTKFNFNGVAAAYYLNNLSNAPATYDNTNSPYYGVVTNVGQIAAYDTNGTPTFLSIAASGSVSGWVNHDTWTGFIYTDVFDALNAIGGNTSAVGSYTSGVSGYGCHDMAGNLWNWTTTLFIASNGAEAGKTVNQIRGGSWYATSSSCRSIDIGEGRAGSGVYNTVGFRIVMIPANPITLGEPVISNGTNFQFTFTSQADFVHLVQYRTNLQSGSWQNYSSVAGDGSVKTVSMPRAIFNGTPQEFFRVTTQ